MYKYDKIKLIGSGGEGKAHLVRKIECGKLYVMKQRDFLLLEEASEGLNEAMSLAKIQCSNIVKFEEVFINQNNNMFSLFMIMEYCEGGDLMNNMIVRVSEIFKSSNENNNSKTNSLSSSNGFNMNTLNVLKCYEEFFSRYLPNYVVNGCENIVTPESLNKDASSKNGGILLSSRSSMDFSLSSSNNNQSNIITPIKNNNNNNNNNNNSIRNSLDDTCLPIQNYLSPTMTGSGKNRTLSFSSKPISNSTPQLSTSLSTSLQSKSNMINISSLSSADILYDTISPIKSGVSIIGSNQNNNNISPCNSGPTSPTFLSQDNNNKNNNKLKSNKSEYFNKNNNINNNINRNDSFSILAYNYNPSQQQSNLPSTYSTLKINNKDNEEKKKSWWRTFKSKERTKSTFNLFANVLSPSKNNKQSPSSHNLQQSIEKPQSLQNLFNSSYSSDTLDSNCKIHHSNSSISLKIPRIPKRLLYSWIFQICLGVQSIHKNKLVHRDLKSENIFLTESQIIKIGDFGLATKYENLKNIKGVAGTYYYTSPEIIQNQSYSRPADIFSLGCIFYEMCTLHILPVTKRCIAEELIEKRFDRKQFKDEFDEEDEQLADLVLEMLSLDPNLRPTIDSIVLNRVFDKLKDPCSIVGNVNLTGSSSSNHGSTSPNNNNGYGTISKRESPLQRNKSIMQILSIPIPEISSASEMNTQRQGITRRQLDKCDLSRAAEILSESFKDDPRFLYVSGGTSSKPEVVNKSIELGNALRKSFFDMCIRLMYQNKFMLWGCFNQENQLIGVACWSAPGKNGPSMVQLIIRVISILPKYGFRVMRRIGKLMSSIESSMRNSNIDPSDENANKDIYYLPYIGVSKDYRCQGVGEYLLKPVIDWAEHQGKKIKAISFTEKQINFFNKLGFSVIHNEQTVNLKGIGSIYVLSKNP